MCSGAEYENKIIKNFMTIEHMENMYTVEINKARYELAWILRAFSDQYSRPHMAVISLQAIGYEMDAIRRILPKLEDLSNAEIGKKIGISRSNVVNTMHGIRRNPRVRHNIARVIGLPVNVLFPEMEALSENDG